MKLYKGSGYVEKEPRTKERKSLYFESLGIPNLLSLSKVELLTTKDPIVPHVHRGQFEICVHYEGCQYYEINGRGYETHAGDIFISFPDEHHSTGNYHEEKSKFFYLIFDSVPEGEWLLGLTPEETSYVMKKLFSVRFVKGAGTVKPILDEVLRLYFSEDPLVRCRINSLMIQFFYDLCRLIDGDRQPSQADENLLAVKDYIDSHITESMSVEDLANMAYVSVSQFKRKFKEISFYNPHDYILRQKIGLAKEMLAYTYMPITEIAYAVGVSSSQLFAKNFKKYTGQTPMEYRRSIAAHIADK